MTEKKSSKFNPNAILISSEGNTIYLPGYMVISIRNFKSLSLQQLTAEVYLTVKLGVNITGLQQDTIKELNNLVLNIPLQGNISMNKKISRNADMNQYIISNGIQKIKVFEIKKIFNLEVKPYIRFTPFQLVDLVLAANVKTITVKIPSLQKQENEFRKGEDSCQIRINLMDLQIDENQIQKKINYNQQGVLGNYDLAQSKLCVQYSNTQNYKSLMDLGKFKQIQFFIRLGQKIKKSIVQILSKLFSKVQKENKNTQAGQLKKQYKNQNKIIITQAKKQNEPNQKKQKNQALIKEQISKEKQNEQKLHEEKLVNSQIKQVKQKKDTGQNVKKQQSAQKKKDKPKDGKKDGKKGDKKDDIKYFQYGHFHIPLYKFPGVSLATVFIPLVLLGVINLAVFFQSPALADRIGNIATLMIAFIGMIEVIRSQIPPSPDLTLVQILVYLQITTTLLCLIESLIGRNDQQVKIRHLQLFFPLSCIITVVVFIIPIFMMLFHHFYLEQKYNLSVDKDIKQNILQFLSDKQANNKMMQDEFAKHKSNLLYKDENDEERTQKFYKKLKNIQKIIQTSRKNTQILKQQRLETCKNLQLQKDERRSQNIKNI